MTDLAVRNNGSARRFEADVPGGTAMITYQQDGDVITLIHTEVPKEASGRGVAQSLAKYALQYARDQKLRVIPKCSYVASFVKRNRDYDDILEPAYRQA